MYVFVSVGAGVTCKGTRVRVPNDKIEPGNGNSLGRSAATDAESMQPSNTAILMRWLKAAYNCTAANGGGVANALNATPHTLH